MDVIQFKVLYWLVFTPMTKFCYTTSPNKIDLFSISKSTINKTRRDPGKN